MEERELKSKILQTLKNLVSHIWYIVALVAVCTLVVVTIWNWSQTIIILEKIISILMPFIIGFFFAYLIYPLVKIIRNGLNHIKKDKALRVKRFLSVLFSYIIVIGVLTIIIIYIYPQLRDSGKDIVATIKNGYQYMINHEEEINKQIPFLDISDLIEYLKVHVPDNLMNYSSNIVPYVYQFSSSVVMVVYNTLIGLVVSIYFVIGARELMEKTREIVYAVTPKGREKRTWKIILQCNHIFNGFLFGKMIDSLIIGILCFIIMLILHLPYALLISVIVGITNMIPYFGPFIGAVPGVIIFFFINPKLSLIFIIMILALQQFDGLYLGPKILGDLTGIKPLWVIFGVTVGGALFGVMGMFLGVPTVAVLSYLFGILIEKKLKKKGISLEEE